nr:immunoglobulin heavy chain junction region [Mus musculus]
CARYYYGGCWYFDIW